jgi:hypothetical protein
MTAPMLCDVEYVLSWLPGQNSIYSDQEGVLEELIAAESEAILLRANREFVIGDSPATRIYPTTPPGVDQFYDEPEVPGYRAGYCYTVEIDDLSAAPTEVKTVDSTGADVATLVLDTDFVMLPRNRKFGYEPYTAIEFRATAQLSNELHVTGVWGFPEIPESIRQATRARVAAKFLPSVGRTGSAFGGELEDSFDLTKALAAAFQAVDSFRFMRVG